MFSKKMLEFLLILNVNMVKPAHETCEILLYQAAFLCFLEKLECGLDRLNTPLSNYQVSFVGFSNSLHDYLLYNSFWEHNSSLWTYSIAVVDGL